MSAPTRATTTHTQSHTVTHVVKGVHKTCGTPYTHVSHPDAVPTCVHPPGPHATRIYTHTRTCRCVHTHTTALGGMAKRGDPKE